ncbi:MAG: NfeD family protein [Actinomycetota bacterium]
MSGASAVAFGVLLAGSAFAGDAAANRVLLAEVDGPITPVVADYLRDSVTAAEADGYQALIVALDTPGGLDVSMRDIAQAFLNSPVPVIVYVTPEGARAASAGTFITMAAHVAAMAPATSIGAATPVDLQGGEITDKVINDAAAFAISVAERRQRNVEFAEAAVRDGRSASASEALEIGVIDLVAESLDDLLAEIDGRPIPVIGGVFDTEGALIERRAMGPLREVLGRLADPNLAFIFLSIGTLAIIYEAANPGLGFSGIAGVIMVVLAFFALSVLPVRAAGVALLVLAVALFVAELFVPGIGVLAAGGTISLILAGLFLFEGPIGVSPAVIWPSAVVLGGTSLIAGRAAVKARKRPPASGPHVLMGRQVSVRREADRLTAFLDGAWWEVRAAGGKFERGGEGVVVGVEGVHLMVEEVSNVD